MYHLHQARDAVLASRVRQGPGRGCSTRPVSRGKARDGGNIWASACRYQKASYRHGRHGPPVIGSWRSSGPRIRTRPCV